MSTKLIEKLQATIGSQKVLLGKDILERYHHIWHMDQPLNALAYLLPENTQEISDICKLCHEHDQKVMIYGGLTNLVGATETTGDEIIISMAKLNKIEEVDAQSRTMTVQAGVILENVQNAAKENELFFPLNFGAKGSAQMGGIISQNAGGLRVLRYGMTRNLILGLEVVLMDGTILNSMKKIIKDNSAYDLKQLFIGSEGTLGIVTKAVLKLQEEPKSRNSAFLAFNEFDKVVNFLKFIDQGLAGSLSGFELIYDITYQTLTSDPSPYKPPIPYGYKYYVLVESLGSDQEKDHAILNNLLEQAVLENLTLDAVMAHSESDLKWFWSIREDVHILKAKCDIDQHFDISAPISAFGDYVDAVMDKLNHLDGVKHAFPFGHLADGNIHFIIGKKNDSDELKNQINDIVYNPLTALGGSVSAEHGIGLHKKAYLKLCRTEAEISVMKMLKKSFDPKGLLNTGKVLDL